MKLRCTAAIIFSCMALASLAPAVSAPSAPQSVIVCRSPAATREIRIYHTEDGGCRVDYQKDNAARTLWRASGDHNYCDARANALAATLARGNFQCDAPGASASTPHQPAVDRSELTEAQIGAANQWLRQRVASLMKNPATVSDADVKRYSASPDFLASADLDADGRTDLIVGWSWATFHCDGANLTVLINDASDAQPAYRAAEVALPGNCGAQGWLAAVKDVKARRIYIQLQQRYPGADTFEQISATMRHGGDFTFFGPTGAPGSLAAIEKALSLKQTK